jgi:hypothetical protein
MDTKIKIINTGLETFEMADEILHFTSLRYPMTD